MRRGFKAEAERVAQTIRQELGKGAADRLDAVELARHIGAEVRRADELTSLSKLRKLEEIQPGSFSACTFTIGSRVVIVFNPLASAGRTQSDIAHEVSHLLLAHQMTVIQTLGSVRFFTCDPDQEQEANWLAGCLLLPRRLLYLAARRGLDGAEIARDYHVSGTMAAFRLRSTGVVRQLEAEMGQRQARRKSGGSSVGRSEAGRS
ncbi:MAG TPA: ImmA/IrrE family metallo-endopeptidase [Candidatus Dormibacteraeota bacterium]|nr:ImmA/IrrE family metallo-endopeptidase [Candidatus Dormibacteraeota bacterium]